LEDASPVSKNATRRKLPRQPGDVVTGVTNDKVGMINNDAIDFFIVPERMVPVKKYQYSIADVMLRLLNSKWVILRVLHR
jgi:hypothetical protein